MSASFSAATLADTVIYPIVAIQAMAMRRGLRLTLGVRSPVQIFGEPAKT